MKRNFIVIAFIHTITIITSDWIKIPQGPVQNIPKDISPAFDTGFHLSSILDKEQKIEKPPSQEWLDYQKLRFSIGDNTQKIIVTETDKLKNSAKVVSDLNKTYFLENSQKPKNIKKLELQLPVKKIDKFVGLESVKLNESLTSEKSVDSAEKIPKPKAHQRTKQNGKEIKDENSKIKKPSFSGFLEYLKSMQAKLISSTAKGINEKINKLAELRDKLLINIEDRIMALWPTKQAKRPKRGILDESQHVFPAAETALMTINFLTFAVFLIKLVLQVIKTIKSKHYNFNGFTVNSMESLKLANARKNARHFGDSKDDIEKIEQILSSIDKFNN